MMSKETKFTKCDWKVQNLAPRNADLRVTCSSNRAIAIVRNGASKYFSVDANRDIFNHSLANANLIKAAPKLYAMLENLLQNEVMDESRFEAASNILAEARGEHDR